MTDRPETSKTHRSLRRGALAAVLLAGTALGGYAAGHAGFAATPDATTPATATQPTAPVNPPGATPVVHIPDFVDLVTQVKPAVVSITTKLEVRPASAEGAMPMPFPFGQMMPEQAHPQAVEARGSGFIINASGIIVTNNHVVKDARSVTVTLSDGHDVPAKVIGRDPRTDIAVLKVDVGHKLPYIQLGDSNSVKPGEWVVAMGNPFGLGGTVTAGIVSAQGRDIGAGPYDQFIQIDAPINQGNSGGPLFTQDGKVVGMNSAILSPSGGSIGIGFAIPSNMIKTVVAQLETSGHVTRGYVGVEAQALEGTMAEALHLTSHDGALVAGVQPNTPAASAGVQPGDVIQSVNGQKVTDPRDLAVDVAAVKPGDDATLGILRNGKTDNLTVKVAELPNEQTANAGQAQDQKGKVGLALAPITPEMRDQLSLPKDAHGAVVAQVQPGSPADQAGIQQGDVIVGVGTQAVASPQEAVRAIHDATQGKDHALALRIIRNGEPAFVAVNLDQSAQNAG